MTPHAYLQAVARRTRELGWRTTVEEVDGHECVMTFPSGSTGLDRVDPKVTVLTERDPGTLTRSALDQYTAAVHATAKSTQGRWGAAPKVSVPGGPMSCMPVVVTSDASDDARAWASKKHGLAFPVLVDVGTGTLTKWRRAIIGAADGWQFASIIDEALRPVLDGEG